MHLLHVVGARPNFMKAAPVLRAASAAGARSTLVHTGQHYDAAMSDAFFADLGLPAPDHNLGVGSGGHGEQTGRTMIAFEPVLQAARPDWVVVYGDVNSTIACALVAAKLGVRVAHVEAGVRSFDRRMPEEINRVLVDRLADLCLTPMTGADAQLRAEGIPDARIRCPGNVQVDTLLALRGRAEALAVPARLGVAGAPYAVATFHRAANVDDPATLAELLRALATLAERLPVLFPVHPRTRARLVESGLGGLVGRTRLLEPLSYLDAMGLVAGAALVLTDSGGLQVETSVLGVPCLTAREATEWTVTLTEGTNRLVPPRQALLVAAAEEVLAEPASRWRQARPAGWDGRAAERAVAAIAEAHAG